MSSVDNIRSWLSWHYWSSGGGKKLWEGVCETADLLMDTLRLALQVRYPSMAPTDALPEIAHNQSLSPPSTLSAATLRKYLADPWSKYKKIGTRGRFLDSAALYGELALLGIEDAEIISWRNLADLGAATAFGGDTSCWYLKISQPSPFAAPAVWDGGDLWDGGILWDVGDPQKVLPQVLALIAKWKPAASSCRFILIELPDGSWVSAPVYEHWELDGNGNATGHYYNENWWEE